MVIGIFGQWYFIQPMKYERKMVCFFLYIWTYYINIAGTLTHICIFIVHIKFPYIYHNRILKWTLLYTCT